MNLNDLMSSRNARIFILLLIIGLSPILFLFIYTEVSFGNQAAIPERNVELNTPRDMWYAPHNQAYPILISGTAKTFYQRPFVMVPANMLSKIFIRDLTDPEDDFSWIDVFDYRFLDSTDTVNVSIIPEVTGSYGDGENYVQGETMIEAIWIGNTNPSVPSRQKTSERYQIGDYFHICNVRGGFERSVNTPEVTWTLLIHLVVLKTANLIDNHKFLFLIETQIEWVAYLGIGFPLGTGYVDSVNTTTGNPSTLYMLNGTCNVALEN